MKPGLRKLALLAALLVGPASAQPESRKSIVAVRTEQPPVVDGRLDDAAWAAAAPDDRFTQFFPTEGQPPTHRTELRFLYDDHALYIGVRLYDEPDQIVARLTRRDRIPESDAVVVRIDSRHDHATAYVFRLHASGVQFDNFFFDDGNGASPEWDAVWAGEVSRDERGWCAEYRIPFSALRFAGLPEETWGLQVVRYTSRTGEQDVWSFWPSTWRGEVSHYDHLVGLRNLRAPRTFELRPYVLGRFRGSTESGGSFLGFSRPGEQAGDGDLGIDVKLGVTSDLSLDFTANPDFGQVEADQVVLNLSRFESFFPEKRPFFLEGTDLFGTPLQLFYSRRIGRPPSGLRAGDTLTAGGEELTVSDAPASLRIWSAGKLTGKLTRNLSVAALGAVTDTERITAGGRELRLAPLRAYSVLRTRYALGGPSYAGLMATGVSRLGGQLFRAADDHDAYAQAADGQWQSPSAAWRLGGQGVVTERVGGAGRATAAGTPCSDDADPGCVPITRSDGTRLVPGAVGWGGTAQASHMGTHHFADISLDILSPLLDPNDAGFLPEFNKQHLNLRGGYQERQPGRVLQNFNVTASQSFGQTFTGTPITVNSELQFNGLLLNRWFVNPGVGYDWAGTWDPRETLDGGRFERPARLRAFFFVQTDESRPATAGVFLSYAHNVRDPAFSYVVDTTITLRLLPQLEVSLGPGLNWDGRATRFYSCTDDATADCTVDTDARHYLFAALTSGALSFTLRATYAFSPRLSLQTYGQLFLAQGTYADYRFVDTAGPRPFIRRADLQPSPYTGDSDGDGVKDDDFEQVAVNANVVLRWEPWPGSAVYAVYTRSQHADPTLAGTPPGFHAAGLSRGPTEDVVALKLVYYWAP